MNRLNLTAIILLLLTIAACKKRITADKESPATSGGAMEECQPTMYNLAIDSASGNSYIYKVAGSPGAGPVTVSPYVVSGSNQLKDLSGNPILRASGLSYDPATNTFYGTTGISGSVPNAILKFTDPNLVTVIPSINSCGIPLNLSDIERDQTTGTYYAINRGTVAPNNRVVRIGLPGPPTVNCLPNPLPVSLNARGLSFDCNGQLFVMHTTGINGVIVSVNKVTGLTGASYAYPGPITTFAAVPIPEIGLHYDCVCVRHFMTGSFNPVTATRYTDGLPSGLGGPVYNTLVNVLKPTVDFARP